MLQIAQAQLAIQYLKSRQEKDKMQRCSSGKNPENTCAA
jgi:hypothetical protein